MRLPDGILLSIHVKIPLLRLLPNPLPLARVRVAASESCDFLANPVTGESIGYSYLSAQRPVLKPFNFPFSFEILPCVAVLPW